MSRYDGRMNDDKPVKKRFKELLRGAQSTREMADLIAREPEPLRTQLLVRLEKWRTGQISPLPDIKGQEHIAKLIVWLVFLSPIIAISLDTLRAISGQLEESRNILADPGHRRIRIYDTLIVCVGASVSLYVMFVANALDFGSLSNGKTFSVLLFPQFTGWPNLVLIYVFGVLIHFYTIRRSDIIRAINELSGVW